MVRVVRGIVVLHMAGAACRWRARISIRMALNAGRGHVLPGQREVGAVVIECGVAPSGLIMTGCTIGTEARCHVVRIGGRIVIVHVASAAGRRGASVSVRMTLDACGGLVRTVQRERRVVVIERGIAPSRFIVAHRAIRAESRSRVVRFRGGVVIGHVAGAACGRGARISIRMALDAVRGRVGAMQGESCECVIERGVPAWARGVASGAIRRESSCRMVWIGRSVVVRQMATGAHRRCIREIPRGVAA